MPTSHRATLHREYTWARTAYDSLVRFRPMLLLMLAAAVVAGAALAVTIRMDMSFRPTFTNDTSERARTAAFERQFGTAGFNELVAIVDVGDASDPARLEAVHRLAQRMHALPHFAAVRDPLGLPFAEADGKTHPLGAASELATSGPRRRQQLVDAVLASPTAQRIVIGDGNRQVAVTVTLDIPNDDFQGWHSVVPQFRSLTHDWSAQTGMAVQITGYPEVEQVYAHEVLVSVFRSVGVLLATMLVILFAFFRRLRDVVICMIGVTLAVPLVLGVMHLLNQPFSIVNSEVLVLVLIVGIAEALQHQQEYRRRREAGRDHSTANREAFSLLAWAALTTGVATAAGFSALLTADMKAIWSFGLCTSLGVVIVYAVNWLTVPALIDLMYRNSPQSAFAPTNGAWSLAVLERVDRLVTRRPAAVVAVFLVATAALGWVGLSRLTIDQKVNQELPAGHPALTAQAAYEARFSGFLGPELSVRPTSGTLIGDQRELAAFVNQLCSMPEVRYVASPLDFTPQQEVGWDAAGCTRQPGDLRAALGARSGRAGPELQRFASALINADGSRASVVVRIADIGTARSMPFVQRVRQAAARTMPGATVEPVGPWWLAQQGMHGLSYEMMLSAVTALGLILPIMCPGDPGLAAGPRRHHPRGAADPGVLAFMGLAGITVRIGTAMILAIALGLATDDTIHLSVRVRDRVRRGNDRASAMTATLLRTGRPASFSSYVLIAGFASMMASSLLALRDMGLVAAFTMTFALVADLVLGPALYLLVGHPRRARQDASTRVPATTVHSITEDRPSRQPEYAS